MAAPDDYIGKIVAAKYRVEEMIGEGGMGKVYKAIQVALDKPVVLKVLRQAFLSDERTVARFQREAKAASRLNHPNSISVLDFGQAEDGAMYIAMEYVQGKDLHHILSREWPLPEARVVRLMSQVLSALADAHSAGVIHRDLKPENIMVEQRREVEFVKVLDFGIAKIVDGSSDIGPALTRAGFVCGTPEYMSPEQARGAQLDHRSDLYAVGVIIYQLMCGMLPFDSDSAVGFATKHLIEIPPPPTKRRPEARVSAAMERLIMKALAKNPDDRPQTAEQFRAELLSTENDRRPPAQVARRPQSVVRRQTPPDQKQTVAPEESSALWTSNETTIRAPAPEALIADDVVTTSPTVSPEVDTTPGASSGSIIIKIAAAALVALALSLGALYGWVTYRSKEIYVPPPDPAALSPRELQDYSPAADQRRPEEAARLSGEGDEAWHKGDMEVALSKYLLAWEADPRPELALKLGELYFQKEMSAEARGWWARYRRDLPGGKAQPYIEQRLRP